MCVCVCVCVCVCIGEAVRIIDDILFHSLKQPNGFLVAVEFEKAFDSVV